MSLVKRPISGAEPYRWADAKSDTKQYSATIGASYEFVADAYKVRGIRVDNLSPYWLYIDSLQRFVAPFTQGWQGSVLPSATRIKVSYGTLPSGAAQISDNDDGYAIVKYTEESLPDVEGTQYSPSVNISSITTFERSYTTITEVSNAVVNVESTFEILPLRTPQGGRYRLFHFAFWTTPAGTADRWRIILGTTIFTGIVHYDAGNIGDNQSFDAREYGDNGLLTWPADGENNVEVFITNGSAANRAFGCILHWAYA